MAPKVASFTIFHLPGRYSSASAKSWATKEPEWRRNLDDGAEGKELVEAAETDAPSSSASAFLAEEEDEAEGPNSREEG